MAWLGIAFTLMVGYEIAVDLDSGAARALDIAGWAVWALFAAEFAAKLWLAPKKGRFLRRHPIQWIALLLPTLRVLRFLRLARLGRALPAARVLTSSYRGAGATARLLRSRLGYLAAASSLATLASAQLAFLFERDEPNGAFETFGDALIWSAGAVIALQADPVPESLGARLVMLASFAVGLVVVASLAGTVGAFLVAGQADAARAGPDDPAT